MKQPVPIGNDWQFSKAFTGAGAVAMVEAVDKRQPSLDFMVVTSDATTNVAVGTEDDAAVRDNVVAFHRVAAGVPLELKIHGGDYKGLQGVMGQGLYVIQSNAGANITVTAKGSRRSDAGLR